VKSGATASLEKPVSRKSARTVNVRATTNAKTTARTWYAGTGPAFARRATTGPTAPRAKVAGKGAAFLTSARVMIPTPVVRTCAFKSLARAPRTASRVKIASTTSVTEGRSRLSGWDNLVASNNAAAPPLDRAPSQCAHALRIEPRVLAACTGSSTRPRDDRVRACSFSS
jgi:hypothetical protein